MNQGQVKEVEGEFLVIFHTGWTTWCKTRIEAEALLADQSPVTRVVAKPAPTVIYAGGTRYHSPAKVLRKSDGLTRTKCGQRGWASENPSGLVACRKCF